jgi:tetratricopeptide (TPR) repeat protein
MNTRPGAPAPARLAGAWQALARDPAVAEQLAAEILAAWPASHEARLLTAVARRRQGNVSGAAEVLAVLVAEAPSAAPVLCEWGLVLAAMAREAEALAALRRAAAVQPNLPAAWQALGDLLVLQGEVPDAAQAYARALRAATRDARLLPAAAALCEGRAAEAEPMLAAQLQRTPDDPAALHLLAAAAVRVGRPAEAQAVLEHCLRRAPGFREARHTLAVLLYLREQWQPAAAHFAALVELDPHDFGLRNFLAVARTRHGDFAGVLPVYESMLADYAGNATHWLFYGHALKTVGRTDDAVRAYRACLDLAPGAAEAWLSLADIKTSAFSAADIAAIRAMLGKGDTGPADKARLNYALGSALERAGAHDGAFAAYAAGARLQRSLVRYDPDAASAAMAATQKLFSREFFAARPGTGSPSGAPIFIVGLPRSGSTLVEQILASHGAVEATMELPDIGQIAEDLRQRAASAGKTFGAVIAGLDAASLARLGALYIARTKRFRRTDRPRFIDKMPDNFRHVGLIKLILPHAKIIDVRRAPMAAGFAMFKQYFQATQGHDYSWDLAETGRYYRDYVALMAHFDAVLPGAIHLVKYERLVADTEAEIRALLAYCGLEFEPACLRFWETARAVQTPSAEQVRQPIFTGGLEQWRHYQGWLGALRD